MQNIFINIENNESHIHSFDNDGEISYDTFSLENERYSFFIQGIILNKQEVINGYGISEFNSFLFGKVILNLHFINSLRGSFYGFLNDKIQKKISIFNDQLGTKCIYYYSKSNKVLVSSCYSVFLDEVKVLNEEGARMLLSYGYMLNNSTILKDVLKLIPGSILTIDYKESSELRISAEQYFRFSISKLSNEDEHQAIDQLDVLFRRAVNRQFDKDKEYKKKHFVALSGGLDSRMTAWVAHDIGFFDQVNFTFSQSDYWDEEIAKKIASDLRHDWIFKFLDNGNFLYDIDEIVNISGGNVLYYGLAHSNSFLKLLNFGKLGILHSGQLGDVVVGSFIKDFDNNTLNSRGGEYSKLGSKIFFFEKQYSSFEEKEIDMIYQRGLNGANSGLTLINNYTETFSPFYDIDFMEFCLSLPIKMRMGHNLYKKWILSRYPGAARYVWESTGRKIDTKELRLNIKGRQIFITDLKDSFLRKLKLIKSPIATRHNMNPLQYWYDTNEDLRSFLDNYYADNILLLKNSELRGVAVRLFERGSAIEKNQVLSLIALVKRLNN